MNSITRNALEEIGGWFIVLFSILNFDRIAQFIGFQCNPEFGAVQRIIGILLFVWCIYRIIRNIILYNEWSKFTE